MKISTAAFLSLVLMVSCGAPAGEVTITDDNIGAMARKIHDRVITIDTHDDIPFNFATTEVDPGVRGDRQVDLPKMREGGLDVGFFIVFVGQGERTAEGNAQAYKQALTRFEAIHRMAATYPDEIELAHSADDVERIVASGKLVAAIGIENGWPVGRDLSRLVEFHALGGRYITLAHNGHNDIADSANPRVNLGDEEQEHGGISDFGAEVIAEMNRVGIMVDVSHISKDAMLEAAQLSAAPVIASHSGARALSDVSRNMDDEQLLALRDNGGVIQTVALRSFVKQTPERNAAIKALQDELGFSPSAELTAEFVQKRKELERRISDEISPAFPSPNVEDFVDHIDHIVNLIGIDHVGISSDFDGGGGVEGWDDASETFNVTLALVRRGYSEDEISKLWGGNTLRVWREVERVASELQADGN